MSSALIYLDVAAAEENFALYQRAFTQQHLSEYYRFDFKLSTNDNLSNLAFSSLKEDLTIPHLYIYKNFFLDCCSRWILQKDSKKLVAILHALGRIASLYPEATQLIEVFLLRNGDYFNALLQTYQDHDPKEIELILLAYYRLVQYDKIRFERYITVQTLNSLLTHESKIIQFLSLKVLNVVIEMAEHACELVVQNQLKLSTEPILSVFEGASDVDYQFLELNEAKRLSNYRSLPNEINELVSYPKNFRPAGKSFNIDTNELSSLIVEVCGVFIARISEASFKEEHLKSDLVYTDGAKLALQKLAKGIQRNKPVMLVGKAGSGKTFLINELSKKMSCNNSVVKIHLGEQTDAKLLLGTYTSGEKPGSFEWRSGVLTTAVKEGRWVLIEDINKAPTEVLSVLLTLLEKREISIPSRGEVIKAANGFQLLATIRLDEHTSQGGITHESDLIGMRLWEKILVDEPSEDDLKLILQKRFSLLTALIPKLISTYKSVKDIYRNPQFVSLNKGVQPRIVSVRDLVKLSQRITILFEANQVAKPDQLIESSIYDDIFAEAVDCFVGSISEYRAVQPLVQKIGEELEVSVSRITLFLNKHVPAIEKADDDVKIGRAHLRRSKSTIHKKTANTTSFAFTNHSLRLMERIGVAVKMCEPTLLVGETGTGKTTVVQELAKLMNKNLTVINVSQQTESGDLLGGYKPVNCRTVAIPILEDFEGLFLATFSLKKNEKFYKLLHKCFSKGQWKNVTKLWKEAIKMADSILKKHSDEKEEADKKKKRKLDPESKQALLEKWKEFRQTVELFELQSSTLDNSFVFNFVEGSLVKAVRNGEWLLLDEVNLASADTLENIADLLSESDYRSILLSEKGEAESIKAHPDFRIFACMNPATDVGKKDLPPGIRSRFTEVYVHSPDSDISDLLSIIDKYISKYSVSDEWVGNDIAELYLEAKRLAEANKIVDGSNQRPHFSIRTLTRTLLYVTDIVHIYGLRRSLYEGFCMAFLTLLNLPSEKLLKGIIEKFILGRIKNPHSVMSQIPPSPGTNYVQFRHYWMKQGPAEITPQPHYIITPFVEKNMLNLVRATSGRRFPVLIQGPTSAGKTSMIKYLADITGHKFVRINNHEHTDLQEYLGTYVTDDTGKLSFKEGVLVEALKKGYWIVLDELNLAPTDVLEALNRLLDDNRELFIPETQEVVHPHPDFMLFATQNPAGIYGGRKVLSRAFRNRFLELHFDDIPQDELEIILKQRCEIAPSYAKRIVEVYRQLSVNRSANRLFEQKNSFATLRDLFRWALRPAVGYEELAANGYMLLAERCRSSEEKEVVKRVLETVMKVKLDMDQYYTSLEDPALLNLNTDVVWTKGMKRLAVLVSSCLKNNEPVLLVGETGCGKTTIFQLISNYYKKELITINAHQNTETGDILGAQRPVRKRSEIQSSLTSILQKVLKVADVDITLEELLSAYDKQTKEDVPPELQAEITSLRDSLKILFEWCDGPLVNALKSGNFFLFDEISLADDSVLERLNSVLEPERSLLLAEKGTVDSFITATDGFQFFATMNPGGDYGKKELSPALKNRFTEIWVPSMEDFKDVEIIVSARLKQNQENLPEIIVKFSEWFAKHFGAGKTNTGVISLRDILAWVDFINATMPELQNSKICLYHGAAMVFIDALGTNNTAHLAANETWLREQKLECVRTLSELAGCDLTPLFDEKVDVILTEDRLQSGKFSLSRSTNSISNGSFTINAPTTSMNMMRVVRALNVRKPILLEGSPGVGKTSLVSALAEYTGNTLTRINLSEQTDLVDLFGFDAPGERTGEFVWRDAPFLRAMQKGEWVLLDEMNLASQSVLEGLNACLDHRGEAYIPELDKVFTRHPNFLVFAAQNPQYQGGGRKGLPKSFVNRFSVVYVDMLTAEDLLLIATHMYPNIDSEVCAKMIQMMSRLEKDVSNRRLWGSAGSPWEFNLRDTLRWLKLLNSASICEDINAADFLEMIVKQRFRTEEDQFEAMKLIREIFGEITSRDNLFKVGSSYLQVNAEVIGRDPVIQFNSLRNLVPLQCNFNIYESVIRCVKHNWPLILVGPTNAGKTDMVKLIASIIGKKTIEFSMNSDVDSMDILGGYEQLDLNRKVANIIQKLSEILQQLITINLSTGTDTEALSPAFALYDFIRKSSVSSFNFTDFVHLFQNFHSLTQVHSTIEEINMDIKDLSERMKKPAAMKFEWFDGMLVKAVEEGHWLILDNANLCSPSVLDRINSLLETDGSLMINECSLTDGKPRMVKPHPDFRLFLTMDPKFGELSRAMRNRGIEVFINALPVRASTQDRKILGIESSSPVETESEVETRLRSLQLDAISVSKIPLSAFISPRLAKLQSLVALHDMSLLGEVSPYLMSSINMNAIYLLNDWNRNVRNSQLFGEVDFCDAVTRMTNYITESGVFSEVETIYSPLDPVVQNVLSNGKEFCYSQSLIPTLNSYIAATVKQNSPLSLTSEAVYFFSLIWYLLEAKGKLDFAEKKAVNGKINELSYFELSTAVAFGRNVKNAPHIEVYKLLKSLIEFALNSIKNIPLFSVENVYNSLFQLYILWIGAYSCSKNKDEAKLRVYQELFTKWASVSCSILPDINKVHELLDEIAQPAVLKTGNSMNMIWEEVRRDYPLTAETWDILKRFESLSNDFDQMVEKQFFDSYPLISQLSETFNGLFKDILYNRTAESENIMEKLKEGISTLNTISSTFLIKRKHYFKDEFTSLLRYLVNDLEETKKIIYAISPNSSVASIDLIKLESVGTLYPPIFNLLWKKENGKFVSHTRSVFSPVLVENILIKSNDFYEFSGGQIEQTLRDGRVLIESMIKSSKYILQDQYAIFSAILKDWILKIIAMHLKVSSLDLYSLSIKELEAEVATSECTWFKPVFAKYLGAALFLLDRSRSLQSLGKAWVLFAVGLLQLYVPSSPYDPAIRDYVIYDNYVAHKSLTESIIHNWNCAGSVLFGDVDSYTQQLVPEVSSDNEPKKPRVFRPNHSIDSLFDEWSAFMLSTVDVTPVISLLESSSEYNSISDSRFEMFEQNTSQFLSRLSSRYEVYSDINDIFTGYVYAMKFGFNIISLGAEDESQDLDISPLFTVDCLAVTREKSILDHFSRLNQFLKNQSVGSHDVEGILIHFLNLCYAHKDSESMIDSLNEILQPLYYRWSLRRMKSEQEAEQKNSLFKFNDNSDDIEAEFKAMFPDYEESVSLDSPAEESSASSLLDAYYEIAKIYIEIFEDPSNVSLSQVMRKGSETSVLLLRSCSDFKLYNLNESMVLAAIKTLSEKTNSFKDSSSTEIFDFYRGTSRIETKKAQHVIQSLWNNVNTLLKEWPEHATLRDLFRVCKEFISYPVSTPMARLLQKLEQVYTFVVEWQKYASSKVSLQAHVDSITNLIVSWRKLELHTWKALFQMEDMNSTKTIGNWWFYLFETIIVGTENANIEISERSGSLLSALNVFFSKSTLGEFANRLRLVKAFCKHASVMHGKTSIISQALQNIISFYEQFTSIVNDKIKTGKKLLEKEISEVILLASWKDVNIDALKQSSRRSHNSLFKIVRKYRALLSEPLTSMIESGIDSALPVTKQFERVPLSHFRSVDVTGAKSIATKIPGWESRSKSLKDIYITQKNLSIYISKITNQNYPDLLEYALYISKEAKRLREETPTVYKKDKKKLLATLKTQKSKLLSDTLKELKRIGLKSNFREDIRKIQQSVVSVLTNSKSFRGTAIDFSDVYFFRILDLLPRLKNAIAFPTDDIPVSYLEKGMAMTENLIFSLIASRQPISMFVHTYSKIESLRLDLESVSLDCHVLKHSDLSYNFETFRYICKWLPQLIDYILEYVENSTAHEIPRSTVLYLYSSKQKLLDFLAQSEMFRIYSDTTENILESFNVFIKEFISAISAMNSTNSFFVYHLLESWLQQALSHRDAVFETIEPSLEEIDAKLRRISTAILIAVQKLVENNTNPISEEDDKWLIELNRRIVSNIKIANCSKIFALIDDLVTTIKSTSFTVEASVLVTAAVSFTMPFINHYFSMLNDILNTTSDNYFKFSKSTYIFSNMLYNLAKDGFCSPEPPSEETEDNNLQEGTGLGDGDGAQNNSKDVEEDEDLLEDAQQPNKDQRNDKDEDDEEEEEAIEMEGDIAGDLENASDQENEEEEDNNEDDEDELDEEIDNLDEDDPNALDEKMWEEEAEDDSKEKDSENMPEKSNADDVQASEEHAEDDAKPEDQQDQQTDEMETEEKDNDDDGEEEEDVGEQEDEVRNDENESLENNVPEVETMDLPEDMNLDSDKENEDDGSEEEEENFEDKMEVDEEEEEGKQPENTENEQTNVDEESGSDENGESDEDVDMDGDDNSETEEALDKEDDTEKPDIKEEAMADSDSELENQQDEPKQEGGEDEKGEDVEGLDGLEGVEDHKDQINTDAAVEQDSGAKGEGSNAADSEEQQDIGSSGNAQSQSQENNQEEITDTSRKDAQESLKQLGDSLKEFHRRHQEIKEAPTNSEEQQPEVSNQKPDEFEHIDGANTETDTQALGSADKDQLTGFDEDLAIDEDSNEEKAESENENNDQKHPTDSMDIDEPEAQKGDIDNEENNGKSKGAFIGERNTLEDSSTLWDQNEVVSDDDDIDQLLNEVDHEVSEENSVALAPRSFDEARELWKRSEQETNDLAAGLSEQLRLILEPTLATKLKGDYKTGKRLNMKRIIPYIASQYRKDKIWLRRTKPSKRQYQIMIAVDDSKSMSESKSVNLAFQSICLVSKALTQLESGGLSIVKFGETVREVHPFNQPFNTQTGAQTFQWFDFQETRTDVKKLVAESIKIFERARAMESNDLWQLEIIISDGVCEDHETLVRLVRRARENKIMLVFVVIDGINSNESIMDMSQVNYIPDQFGNMKLSVQKYLDTFPFEFYVVVHDITELPEMLSIILRQYFSEMASM